MQVTDAVLARTERVDDGYLIELSNEDLVLIRDADAVDAAVEGAVVEVVVTVGDNGYGQPVLFAETPDSADCAFHHVRDGLAAADPITALTSHPKAYVRDTGSALLKDPPRTRDRAGGRCD